MLCAGPSVFVSDFKEKSICARDLTWPSLDRSEK